MRIRVKLFALPRQLTGEEEIEVALADETADIAGLRAALVAQYPALAEVATHLRFAVNSEFAGDARPLKETDEVAAIPPVSGG